MRSTCSAAFGLARGVERALVLQHDLDRIRSGVPRLRVRALVSIAAMSAVRSRRRLPVTELDGPAQ
jgi:hypothetical protein